MTKNRVKGVLVGCVFFLCVAASVSYGSADITIFGSSVGPNNFKSIHFDYSQGEKLVASWHQNPPDTVDVMVLNIANYSLFLDGMSFETVLTMNNSEDGHFILEDLPADVYVVMFYNDQAFGVGVFYQVTLVELPCVCTDLGEPDSTLTLILSLTGFGVGTLTMAAIALVLWRLKMRNY